MKKIKKNFKIFTGFIIFLGIVFVFYGIVHIFEWDKDPVIPKQDIDNHRFTISGKSYSIIAEAYLMPDYNLLYSYEQTPVKLKLDFSNCYNCLELKDGVTFWFFYEKINGSGSGGSIMSWSPDDFYNINIKPGEIKEINGWVQFTGEGVYRHVLYNATNHIRLESETKNFIVYPNYISYQIRSNRVIESFSYITAGLSSIMIVFICLQEYNSLQNRSRQDHKFKILIEELKQINTIIQKPQPKKKKEKNNHLKKQNH